MSKLVKPAAEPPRTPETIFGGGPAKNILSGLFDLRFRKVLTTRIMPLIYSLILVLTLAGTGFRTARAFEESTEQGLIWLLLLDPVIIVATLATARIVLEILLALFSLLSYLDRMTQDLHRTTESVYAIVAHTDEIVGNTDNIADQTFGLPRIPLSRSLRTLRESMQESIDRAAAPVPVRRTPQPVGGRTH